MIVIVGGHSRKIGKTSVVTGLISALAGPEWTAVKISANRNGSGSNGSFLLTEEERPGRECDSGRFLAAGAARSYLLRASDVQLPSAVPLIRKIAAESKNLIVESNRLLEYVSPDLYLVVLDFTVEDFKESSRRFISRADAFVVVDRGAAIPPWPSLSWADIRARATFQVRPPEYVTPEMVRFVAQAGSMHCPCQKLRSSRNHQG